MFYGQMERKLKSIISFPSRNLTPHKLKVYACYMYQNPCMKSLKYRAYTQLHKDRSNNLCEIFLNNLR